MPVAGKMAPATCPYCGCGCGVFLSALAGGRTISETMPVSSHPVNRGTLCFRGWKVSEFINSGERLTSPLLRKNGTFEKARWDEALEHIARRLREVREKHGASSTGVVSSAKCSNEEIYFLHKFALEALGTKNIDGSARLYQTAALPLLSEKTGLPLAIKSLEEIESAELIVLFGLNPTSQQPQLASRILKAVKKGSGLIVADPRRTQIAAFGEHLPILPGGDLSLLLAFSKVILEENLYDREKLLKDTSGFDAFQADLSKFDFQSAEKSTGLPLEKIRETARRLANSATLFIAGPGIAQQAHGTEALLALCNLALLSGNAARDGAGVFLPAEQNNALGAVLIARHFASKAKEPPLTLLEILEEASKGKIKALYFMGGNILESCPDPDRVRKALSGLDFLGGSELFLTRTAALAEVVLPAASFAEKDGTFTNCEGRVQRIRPVLPPPGEALPDWKILSALAEKFGVDMAYPNPEKIFEDMTREIPEYDGMKYADLENPGGKRIRQAPTGKPAFIQVEAPLWAPNEYPFTLLLGRIHPHWNSGNLTSRSFSSRRESPTSFVQVNPKDAERLKIREGWKVKVSTPSGELSLACSLDDSLPEGVIFVPLFAGETPANVLAAFAYDRKSGIPAFNPQPARIEAVR
jgi:predicted molibdopterin-dependent oxidoreductase YjgC